MKVLYLGEERGTSLHRVNALRRLGSDVRVIDPRTCFGRSRLSEGWIWRAGGFGMDFLVRRYVLGQVGEQQFDVCIVNHGELIGASLLRDLRSRVRAILSYNSDNPFVTRDKLRWRALLRAMPLYDLLGFQRFSTAEEGARRGYKTLGFYPTADEVVHRRRHYDPVDERRFSSDVSFVGTWFPERGGFITRLIEAGIDVRIYGANWHKAPEYDRFKDRIVISQFVDDDDYVRAVQYSKIALGFVSIGNQDLCTKRSVEVPALGTLLCAKRTKDHVNLYNEDKEAVFWDDINECAAKCRALLSEPERLIAIAEAGERRQACSNCWNEVLMKNLVEVALANAVPGQTAAVNA